MPKTIPAALDSVTRAIEAKLDQIKDTYAPGDYRMFAGEIAVDALAAIEPGADLGNGLIAVAGR